jgi:hypothetical protein
MERLKHMKEMLVGCIEGQMSHLDKVDTKELGEAIDMVKDLSEAIYYCTITEAMEGKGYDEKVPPYEDERYMDRMKGRMYYDGRNSSGSNTSTSNSNSSTGGTRYYSDRELPLDEIMHDRREGRSPMSRKMYMESKEMHKDKASQLQELEKYAQELTADMIEMIEDASPEEKQYLSNRLT